jgi:hypothetical protein
MTRLTILCGRLIGVSLFLVAHCFSYAQAPENKENDLTSVPKESAWGSHGMAVFGGHEALYASHLPMFHAPHDTQMIIRFHLQNADTDRQLRQALSETPGLWTLDPEAFDLLRFAPGHRSPLRKFEARFVQGHFERGGQERFAKAQLIVDEVIVFRRLSAEKKEKTKGIYYILGKGHKRFIVKEIDRRPDFDLIASVDLKRGASLPASITLPVQDLRQLTEMEWHVALSKCLGRKVRGSKILYFELEDLR